ncbi:MAG: acylphosphatase [Bryobacteraceae bacterium]
MARARRPEGVAARRYYVQGRVQGVGFRYFVERVAGQLGIAGYTRNMEDGRVEVYAIGTPEELSELAGHLWKGPRMSDVRGIEEMEASLEAFTTFHVEYF